MTRILLLLSSSSSSPPPPPLLLVPSSSPCPLLLSSRLVSILFFTSVQCRQRGLRVSKCLDRRIRLIRRIRLRVSKCIEGRIRHIGRNPMFETSFTFELSWLRLAFAVACIVHRASCIAVVLGTYSVFLLGHETSE